MHYNKEQFVKAEGVAQGYLTSNLTRTQRLVVGQMRMRSHSLGLEKGTWAGIPKTDRICKLCVDKHDIEDEEHTLLKCPAYEHIR